MKMIKEELTMCNLQIFNWNTYCGLYFSCVVSSEQEDTLQETTSFALHTE